MGKEKTQFKPGQSGNPGGRSKVEAELDKLRRMNLEQFSEWTQKLWLAPLSEINELVKRKDLPLFVHMVLSVMLEIHDGGRAADLACLLPYIVGKPKDTIAHELPEPTIIHFKDGSKLEMGVKKNEDPS